MIRWTEVAMVAAALVLSSCSRASERRSAEAARAGYDAGVTAAEPAPVDPTIELRRRMVAEQIEARGVRDPRVLEALGEVPRHEFIPDTGLRSRAYQDQPQPIGHGQTISQPYVVAAMTELAGVGEGDRVLEIGTGSGYQAAVLAALGADVYSIEIVEPLAEWAAAALARTGYGAVQLRVGDGYQGWPEVAPFAAIVVTAAPPYVPAPLRQQLAVGGRLIIPVGADYQELKVITRTEDGFTERTVFPVRFVPMTGEAQR
ncbi:MAG TPA: protein-L-isoaspartate(D-aspartate) O-methyltransferase [Kofleriaceae bacterium]|nr:protein-L-isoaspartate(D-aspartate) O-methyltransferase [Kofleriaceae bacterium]